MGRPLPADSLLADMNMPLPPPAFEDDGRIQSKYHSRREVRFLLENVKNTDEWPKVKEDAVFSFDANDCKVMTVEEWVERRERTAMAHQDSDLEKEDGELTQETNTEEETRDAWDIMDSLEDALNNGEGSHTSNHASAYYMSTLITEDSTLPPEDLEARPEDDHAQSTEDKLAALGVTGDPKPVHAPARPYPPPQTLNEVRDIPPAHSNEIQNKGTMRQNL